MNSQNIKADYKRKPELSPLIYGKIPPQAIELEAAVLGAAILQSECLLSVSEIIHTPEVFYKDQHQMIYAAIQATVKAGSRVDMLTIVDQLKKLGTLELSGGAYAVAQLTMNVVSSAHVADHAGTIRHYWQCREIIRLSGIAMTEAYEPDADPSLISETLAKSIGEVMDAGNSDTTVHISVVAGECLETAEKAMNNPGMLTGVETGLREVNRVTNGWQRQSVNILAARPSQGKTALALILSLNSDKPVLFFSLEMSRHELTNRMLSSISAVPLEDIQRGTMSVHQMTALIAAKTYLSAKKILIDDKAGLSTTNFLSRLRRWKRKYNIGLAVVDYLQLMQTPDGKGKSRENVVSEISRSLKLGAKDCEVAIIALSQMNREVEKAKRKPQLSDLRESGAIEQDADIVMFIWHEEDPNDGRIKNKVVFAKNRNGKTEDVELRFVGATQKWTDIDEYGGEPFNPYAGIKSNHSQFEEEPF